MAKPRAVSKDAGAIGNPVSTPAPEPTRDPTQDDLLARLKRMFSDYQTLTSNGRTECAKDIDYYDGKQWSGAELQALAKRNQPAIVINRIKPAINGILGVMERGKSDPRAWPRTPQDED